VNEARTAAVPASPFKGLASFAATDVDVLLFFGREREAGLISANLMASRLTVLYGESGVGKTSLLGAGVVHRLRATAARNLEERGHPEFVVVMFSGWSGDPVAGLAAETRRALTDVFGASAAREPEPGSSLANTLHTWGAALGCDVLLVLDQFEEYFLYHELEEGPATFAEELPELVTRGGLRVSVVLAVREDALAKLDRFKGRIPNLFGNYLRLDHLDREAARSAILGPVRRYNELDAGQEAVRVEDELVEAVLDETAAGRVDLGQSGRGIVRQDGAEVRIEAPFLQLVLERLWDEEIRQGSRTLRVETLRRLGGAAEIVRNHLDRALDVLTPAQRDLAANLFNYLVTPSGTKIAHAPGDLAQYAAAGPDDVAPVLTTLVRERILRPAAARDGGTRRSESPVEIFHDVLTDAVLAWRSRHESERAIENERRAAERRHRRAMVLAGTAMLALAAVAAFAIFALVQRGEAREQAREARAQRAEARAALRTARAGELAARGATQLAVDPDRALVLALQAAGLRETREVENVLRSALISSRVRAILPGDGPVTSASFSSNGRWILTVAADGKARLYAAATHRLVRVLDHGAAVRDAAFGAGGTIVATAGADGAARLWRTASGAELHTLRQGGGAVETVSFSTGGRFVVTAGADGTARIWATADGAALTLLAHDGPVRAASFNPAASLVVTVSNDRYARVFSASSGTPIFQVDQGGRLRSARFSPTGRLLVTAGDNEVARVWSVATGRVVDELRGHEGPVLAAVPGPRGKLLVTTSTDGTARIWNLPTGELRSVLTGHMNLVTGAAFDRAGFSIVTVSTDRTARVWKPGTGNVRVTLSGHTESVTDASFSPDGREVVTASDDGTARVWDPQVQPELSVRTRLAGPLTAAVSSPDGRLVLLGGRMGVRFVQRASREARPVPRLRSVTSVALSSDGALAAASSGTEAIVWRISSGRRVRALSHDRRVVSVVFAPDDRRIATADGRMARIWRLDGTLVRTLRGHRAAVTDVAFSPDGRRLVTASADRTARIWDRATGSVDHVLRGHRGTVTSAAFSADGRRVVTASSDKDGRTWDVRTGRLLRVLRGHFAVVSDAAFSADGRWIVTAGPITAGLWYANSGRLLLYLRGPEARLTSASFDPGGKQVLVTSADGTLRAYDCEICGGIRELRALATTRLAGSRR
jgi:WD40 repeat protein